jgi:hypothetical protein
LADFTDRRKWDTRADDLVAVIRALEPVIVLGARSLDGMESHYSVSHGRTWLSKQIDLHDAVSRLPGPVDWITYTHDTSVEALSRPGTRYNSFRLNVSKPSTGGAIGVELIFSGPDTPEAHGLWEQMQNRLTAEIRRQDESGRTAEPQTVAAEIPVSSRVSTPGAPAAPAKAPEATSEPGSSPTQRIPLWRRITKNEYVVGLTITVVGGLIVLVIWSRYHGDDNRGNQPAPQTPLTTSTIQAPSSTTAPVTSRTPTTPSTSQLPNTPTSPPTEPNPPR